MNKTLNMALRLLVICSVAALSLGIVNGITAPKIKALEEAAKNKTLAELIDKGAVTKEIPVDGNDFVSSYYPIEDGGEIIGYILYINGKGYAGAMTLMTAYKKDGSVIGAKLMANGETPGFGKKAEKAEYMVKFIGHGAEGDKIPLFKYEVKEKVDSVTGATITFMGVSKAIKKGSDFVKGGIK